MRRRVVVRYGRVCLAAVGLGVWFAPGRLLACAACYGQSDSPLAAGMNWGIFSLLGFIVVVLGGVAGFFVFLSRRARLNAGDAAEPMAEQMQLPMLESSFAARGSRRAPAFVERRRHCSRKAGRFKKDIAHARS